MWIKFEEKKPDTDKWLYYYFKHVGVWKGKYYGNNVFACDVGFLTDDVTHWQYDKGQEKPKKPEEKKML